MREGSSSISDLVLLGAGGKNAIYVRLRSTLSLELPKALGDTPPRAAALRAFVTSCRAI